MWYMPMHIAELIARIICLCMKMFFLIKQAILLAIGCIGLAPDCIHVFGN
jgi:hypothetical protein